jgi:hypothetical protein
MSNLGVLGVFRLKFYFFEHTIMIYVQNVCHVLAFSERSEHFLFLQFVGPGQLKMIPPPPPDLDDWVIPEDRHSMPCCVQFLRAQRGQGRSREGQDRHHGPRDDGWCSCSYLL